MNDELFRLLMHGLGQAGQLANLDDSLHLQNYLIKGWWLTLALEIVDVVLGDDHAALLMPIILVYLDDLAGHHNDLSSSYHNEYSRHVTYAIGSFS